MYTAKGYQTTCPNGSRRFSTLFLQRYLLSSVQMLRRVKYLLLSASAVAFLSPLTSQANQILFMDPVITNACINVCPDLTTGLGDGIFHLVGTSTLRGALVSTFQVPGSYQGG